MGDKINRFDDFYGALKTLCWSIFEPGHPEVIGCSEGVSRYISYFMFAMYNVVIVIILLNLLVALMGDVMCVVEDDKINNWKFHRTHVWMEYCRKVAVLPSPLNLPDLAINMIRRACLKRG
jgi:hypothetical protein